MTTGGGGEAEASGEGRTIVYCLIPSDLAPGLHGALDRHFAADPGVEVVVEQRGRERRSGVERRTVATALGTERRRIRGAGGRRVGERRTPQVPVDSPPLPRRARRHLERLRFVERVEPASQEHEDLDTARLVTRFQAGDRDVFSILYTRYFDRVYRYLSVLLSSRDEAEDATQQVFLQVFEGLAGYERRSQPFRAWLFTVVRYYAISQLRKTGRVDPVDPETLRTQRELQGSAEPEPQVLNWITDRDLLVFVERLPVAQRQVLLLRFMLDLSHAQVATALGRSESDVRALQTRALRFLRRRLAAVGRIPSRGDRARSRQFTRQARVLRRRRFALTGR